MLVPKIPPTKLVDRSYSAYKKTVSCACPKSHQRSWWIVHTQPTKRGWAQPGFKSHQRSWWIVHTLPTKRAGRSPVLDPTNAVGGSFILCLQKGLGAARFQIPPTT